MKASLPWQYMEETMAFRVISQLIQRLQELASESKVDVVVPFLNLYELFPKEISRDMRDFQHFVQLLKTITLLHYFQRPYMKMNGSKLLVATLKDVETALAIYEEIFETTRTGTERRILDFYHNIVKTKDCWYLKELTFKYNEKARKKLSQDGVRKMLQRLDEIGYVNTEKNDEDKRLNVYVPLVKGEEKAENPRETDFPAVLGVKLQKGFKTWKETIGISSGFYIYKNISQKTWGEAELPPTELESIVIGDEKFSSVVEADKIPIVVNEESGSKPEKGPEISGKPISQQISNISQNEPEQETIQDMPRNIPVKPDEYEAAAGLGLIPCPYCRSQGRKMFFATDFDLRAHISTFHEPQSYTR
jgi:DNA-binding MarR family transcriptional regulator